MTSFYNSIFTWRVGTSKLQMHIPIPCRFSKVFTSECSIVVSQYFHQQSSLKKTFSNCQITVAASCWCSGRHIANLKGPQSIIVRKFSPLWWVMSIANLFQLSFTLGFPFFQRTGTGSINRQVSWAFSTDLAVSLDTCESTNLAKYKVHFAPGCPL